MNANWSTDLTWSCRDLTGVKIAMIWVNAIVCVIQADVYLPPISFFIIKFLVKVIHGHVELHQLNIKRYG